MDIITSSTVICSIIIIIAIIYSVFRLFEKSKPKVEYIVLLAFLVAISVVGRLISLAIPSVQVASFIIIMVGVVYGRENGLIVGMLAALVSDLALGLGYWTVYQMIAWGLMGFTAGLLSSQLENKYIRPVFGFVWGFLFGWITDISMMFFVEPSLNGFIGVLISGAPFDLIHGVVNAVLLIIAFSWFKKIFERSKDKYLS